MEFEKLTVYHYGEKTEEDRRITISPAKINVVAAQIEDIQLNGRSLKAVTVLFMDGSSIDLLINHADLERLEVAIGSYSLG